MARGCVVWYKNNGNKMFVLDCSIRFLFVIPPRECCSLGDARWLLSLFFLARLDDKNTNSCDVVETCRVVSCGLLSLVIHLVVLLTNNATRVLNDKNGACVLKNIVEFVLTCDPFVRDRTRDVYGRPLRN